MAVSSSHLYWANSGATGHPGTIREANLNGTGAKTIAQGQVDPIGVAVGSSHLYWSTEANDAGTIVEANLNGTGAKTIYKAQYPGPYGAYGVAVSTSHLYWATDGTIDEANLNGTGVTTTADSEKGYGPYRAPGVAVSSSHLYWANGACTIRESTLNVTSAKTIASRQCGASGVAVGP